MKNLNIKPGDQFIFLDNTLKIVQELDLRTSIGYEVKNIEQYSDSIFLTVSQNNRSHNVSIYLSECIIEEFDDHCVHYRTNYIAFYKKVDNKKGNCFARVDLKTEDFNNLKTGDFIETEKSKLKHSAEHQQLKEIGLANGIDIDNYFFIPKDSEQKSESEIKAKKDQIIQVATQIYSAKIISNKNGHFESNIKSSIEEAIFLIEKVESLEL